MEKLFGIFVIIVVAALFAAIASGIISYALNEETEKTKKPAKYRIRPKYYGDIVGCYYIQKKRWYGWVTPLDEWGKCYWVSPSFKNYREILMATALELEKKKSKRKDNPEIFYFDV